MSTALARPGTYITETLLPGRVAAGPQSPPAAFVGTVNRGPSDFARVSSWNEYTDLFGGFEDSSSVLPYSVFYFFRNGGKVAYVARSIGANGSEASITLQDRNETTPQDILTFFALNQGTWGNDLSVTITDGSSDGTNGPGDFALFNVTISTINSGGTKIVERFIDVSVTPNAPRYITGVINGKSTYVRVSVDVANTTAEGLNRPALQTNTPFTGGIDPDAPTQAEQLATIQKLDAIEQPLLLVVPGEVTTTNVDAITSYVESRGDIFFIADVPSGDAVADTIAYADTLTRTSYAAAYAPWVTVVDPGSSARGATRLVPPSGLVAGQFVNTDLRRGVFKTPAGVENILQGAVDLETKFTATELGDLNTAGVNALKPLTGRGIAIYGGRTLRKTTEVDRYVGPRRTLISVKRNVRDLLEFAQFENNDNRLWTQVTTVLSKYLKDLWQSGGLAGGSANDAFYVLCDETNNTDISIEQGILNVEIGIALQYPAEFVVVTLTQISSGGTTASESI